MTGMRCLHWFSPLPPLRTGIADYTAAILPLLCEQASVVLWTDQENWDSALERHAPVRRFDSKTLRWADLRNEMPGGDHIPIYHFGNNGPFHKGIWEASRKLPGISVLHDTRLQHLFAHIIRDCYQDHDLYISVMTKYYGAEGAHAAESFLAGGRSTEQMAERFPLVSLAAEGSVGTIVHSSESLDLIGKEGYQPAAYLSFPYAARREEPIRSAGPPFRIAICGYLGPNRRLDSILKALAAFPLKDKFRVEIYGSIWDPPYIHRLIEEGGLQKLVSVNGFVPDLDAALRVVHLAINLRFPTMGEASMSQLQLWDHGIPSMVTPVGWYAQVPHNTVVFVRPDCEIEDIHQHLNSFLESPERFFEMGDRARTALKEVHDPRMYVQQLLEFASLTGTLLARKAVLETAARVGDELGKWLPARSLDEVEDRVTDELYTLVEPASELSAPPPGAGPGLSR
jgi:glycosyltransferase involved in cell wall biosynthesis